MTLLEIAIAWLPSVLVASVGFLAKTNIENRFATKLEQLRHDLAKKESDIAALRSGALASLSSRNEEMDKRRIVAIEAVWSSACAFHKHSGFMQMMRTIDVDASFKIIETASHDEVQKIKQFFDIIWTTSQIEKIKDIPSPDIHRPFVDLSVWATFAAYRMAFFYPVAQLTVLRMGGSKDLLRETPTETLDAIKQVIPHQAGFIEQFGAASIPYLIDPLHQAILSEISKELNEDRGSSRVVRQAAGIIQEVASIDLTRRPVPEPPAAIRAEPIPPPPRG